MSLVTSVTTTKEGDRSDKGMGLFGQRTAQVSHRMAASKPRPEAQADDLLPSVAVRDPPATIFKVAPEREALLGQGDASNPCPCAVSSIKFEVRTCFLARVTALPAVTLRRLGSQHVRTVWRQKKRGCHAPSRLIGPPHGSGNRVTPARRPLPTSKRLAGETPLGPRCLYRAQNRPDGSSNTNHTT